MGASVVLFVAGIASAVVVGGDDHVGPAGCARRVARVLHLEVVAQPSVEVNGDRWTATLPSGRLIVRVEGEAHDVTGVQALAGPGADVLNRPQRLIGLAVQC